MEDVHDIDRGDDYMGQDDNHNDVNMAGDNDDGGDRRRRQVEHADERQNNVRPRQTKYLHLLSDLERNALYELARAPFGNDWNSDWSSRTYDPEFEEYLESNNQVEFRVESIGAHVIEFGHDYFAEEWDLPSSIVHLSWLESLRIAPRCRSIPVAIASLSNLRRLTVHLAPCALIPGRPPNTFYIDPDRSRFNILWNDGSAMNTDWVFPQNLTVEFWGLKGLIYGGNEVEVLNHSLWANDVVQAFVKRFRNASSFEFVGVPFLMSPLIRCLTEVSEGQVENTYSELRRLGIYYSLATEDHLEKLLCDIISKKHKGHFPEWTTLNMQENKIESVRKLAGRVKSVYGNIAAETRSATIFRQNCIGELWIGGNPIRDIVLDDRSHKATTCKEVAAAATILQSIPSCNIIFDGVFNFNAFPETATIHHLQKTLKVVYKHLPDVSRVIEAIQNISYHIDDFYDDLEKSVYIIVHPEDGDEEDNDEGYSDEEVDQMLNATALYKILRHCPLLLVGRTHLREPIGWPEFTPRNIYQQKITKYFTSKESVET